MLEAGAKYLFQDKLYIWERRKMVKKTNEVAKTNIAEVRETKLTGSKLKDLAWSLDVLDLNKHQN